MRRAVDPTSGVMDALLELRLELSLLNHRVASEVGLNDTDLDCLEVVSRRGPTSPAQLGRRLGVHPATMTGILSRLVDAGWIERAADPNDRRASVLRISSARDARLRKRYAAARAGLQDAVDARSPAEIAMIVAFLSDLTERLHAAAGPPR